MPENGKVACNICGQDWITEYRRKDTGEHFYLCPECESVWTVDQSLQEPTENYLSEYMTTGSSGKDWELIEPVTT